MNMKIGMHLFPIPNPIITTNIMPIPNTSIAPIHFTTLYEPYVCITLHQHEECKVKEYSHYPGLTS